MKAIHKIFGFKKPLKRNMFWVGFLIFVIALIFCLGFIAIHITYLPQEIKINVSEQYGDPEWHGHSIIYCKPDFSLYGFPTAPDRLRCTFELNKSKLYPGYQPEITAKDHYTSEKLKTSLWSVVEECGEYRCVEFAIEYTDFGMNHIDIELISKNMKDSRTYETARLYFEAFTTEQIHNKNKEKLELNILLLSLSLFSSAIFVKTLKDILYNH